MDEQHLYRQKFLIKLVDIIYANLGDENFGAKELAKAAGISQRKLSHKLQNINKTSVCRFICETRLHRAMEMLQKEDVTASEVAYKVGFASPTYFNKCFREFFGFPPGKIKKEGLDNPRELNPVKTRSHNLQKRSFLLKFGYIFAGILILTVLYLTISYFSKWKTSASGASSSNSIKPEKSIAVLSFLNNSPDNEEKRIDAKPTKDLLAHSLLMRGDEMINKWWAASDSQYLRISINFFNEALKIDPDYLDALVGKGGAYSLAGKYDSAMIYYKKVIKIDGEDRYVLGGLGGIYMGSYMTDSAVQYFQKLVEVSPNDPYSNIGLGRVLVVGRFDVIKGLPFLQKAIEIGGNSLSEPLLYIGNAYFIIGEYTKALKYFNKTLLLEPSWCGIDRFYSNILFIQGRYQEALNFLDSIQNFAPCQNSSDVMRFYYYTFQRNFKNAEIYYNKSLNSGKSYFNEYEIYLDVYFNYLLKETGRKNEAVKRINNSIKRYEADMMNFNLQWSGMNSRIDKLLIAASYAMLGENEKALDYLSQLEKFGLFEYPITLAFPGFDNLRNNPAFKAIVKHIEDQRAAVRERVREMEDSGELNL